MTKLNKALLALALLAVIKSGKAMPIRGDLLNTETATTATPEMELMETPDADVYIDKHYFSNNNIVEPTGARLPSFLPFPDKDPKPSIEVPFVSMKPDVLDIDLRDTEQTTEPSLLAYKLPLPSILPEPALMGVANEKAPMGFQNLIEQPSKLIPKSEETELKKPEETDIPYALPKLPGEPNEYFRFSAWDALMNLFKRLIAKPKIAQNLRSEEPVKREHVVSPALPLLSDSQEITNDQFATDAQSLQTENPIEPLPLPFPAGRQESILQPPALPYPAPNL